MRVGFTGRRVPRLPMLTIHAKQTSTSNGGSFSCARSLRPQFWQAHVYGEVDQDLETACRELHPPLHVFSWNEGTKDAGLKRDALYLVRPDGYIALASFEPRVVALMNSSQLSTA